MIVDGLPSQTALTIKLYFCDVSKNAIERANAFHETLNASKSKDYSQAKIQYYEGVEISNLNFPSGKRHGLVGSHKKARRQINFQDISSKELLIYLNHVSQLALDQKIAILQSLNRSVTEVIINKIGPKRLNSIFPDVPTNIFNNLPPKASVKLYQHAGRPKDHRKTFVKAPQKENKENKENKNIPQNHLKPKKIK